jgi:hypothetical protein
MGLLLLGQKKGGVKRHRTILMCFQYMPHPPIVVRVVVGAFQLWKTLVSTRHPAFLTDFHRIISSLQYFVVFFTCMDGYLPKFVTPLCHAIWSSEGACLFYKVIGCRAWLPHNHQKEKLWNSFCVCAWVFCLDHFVWFPSPLLPNWYV